MKTSPKLFIELCYEHSFDKRGLDTMPAPVTMQISYPEGTKHADRIFDRKRLGMVDVPVEIINLMLENDNGNCGISGTCGHSAEEKPYDPVEEKLKFQKSLAESQARSAIVSKWLYDNTDKIKWGITHSTTKLDFMELSMRYIKNYEALKGCIGITDNGKLEAMSEELTNHGVEDAQLHRNYVNMFVIGEMSKELFPEKIPGDEEIKNRDLKNDK